MLLTLAELAGLLNRSLGALDNENLVFIRHPDSDEDAPISDITIEDGMVILIPDVGNLGPEQ